VGNGLHERTAVKVARYVLRRRGGSNPALLFDYGYVKKLKTNHHVPLYSLRVGREYRCILTILDQELVVFVIEAGHRSTVYRKY